MSHKRRLLRRRGGVFYYRQRVPRALVPMLGRCEIQRSLRTADHREALLRAAVVELGVARRWRALLAMRGGVMRSLDQHGVERVAEEYYERLVAEDRAGRHAWRPIGQVPYGCPDEVDPDEVEFDMHVFAYWSELQDEGERQLRGDRRSVKEDLERAAAGRDFDEDTRERLAFAMQCTRMRYLRAMAEELEADFSGRPRAATIGGAQAANVAAAAAANTGSSPTAKTITEAVQEWVHEEGREWKKKTLDETQRALRWLVQVVGDVRPDTVKREDMKRFKANVERVPRGTVATADIRTFAANVPERALDRATVTKLLGRVVAFFSWTVDRQWIRTSPAAGLLKNGKKRGREARELRESFTRTELERIFGADYAENERRRPARFWLPVLALYTGARRGELAHLLVEDVREVEGVLVLDLNEDGDGKSLKTEASRRKVPVHSQVLELGFLDFVEARRREGDRRLFPDVEQNANGWGDEVGKWFTRWRRAHAVTSNKKTLHSMRHTVKDALTRAGVAEGVVKAVQGWEGEGAPYDWYGSAPRLDELRAAVERLDWREPLAALFERER